MATTVTNNPFDTQQPSNSGGVIGGAIQSGSPTNAAQYTPQQRDVNRATETASGQVDSLLAKDSPLMQRARTLAMQNMNARGLVNSSMAQGAGVAAMIDRITPIAQQDAETYSNRALANMQAVNEGGMFNVAESNKFGLQRGQQDFQTFERLGSQQFQTGERLGTQSFQSGERKDTQKFQTGERLGSQQFQTSERVDSQNFQSREAQLLRSFQAAQADLDRALQESLADKSIEATANLENARQNFQSAQNALQREQEVQLQQSQQTYQSQQNQLDRQQQSELAQAAQDFQASQGDLERAQQIMLADKNISAQQALQQAQQEFTRGENQLDRQQQTALNQAAQEFQASQAELDRAQQILIADKNISAQQALEQARQEFESGERALDRSQQLGLQQAQQQFEATQSQLDRDQQASMIKLQNDLSQANVSGTFAANITANTSSAINAIIADGNLTPDAKRGAIQNIIDNANATLQWGSTFYNTELPGIGNPGAGSGGTPPSIAPGGTVQPGGLPSTMVPGQTNDTLWEQVLRENYDAHVARYGVDWNTSRTTEAERANALASMQAEYERRKQGLVGGAMAG